MKYALLVLLCLSLLLLGFLWLLYHGSGHNIPVETDQFLAGAALINIGFIGLLVAWIRRSKWAESQRQKSVNSESYES